ncbi:hypothetical protein Glove_51g37 [Diversispora epigaea]|uniref:Uncharacterized protein n=1 Tax=Diversispora epigaea TaxID=1348612 RepID=A0A397JPK1_9GLOM|nr:hypothetical protein Glove_51g37 [Diversispora epigaea]
MVWSKKSTTEAINQYYFHLIDKKIHHIKAIIFGKILLNIKTLIEFGRNFHIQVLILLALAVQIIKCVNNLLHSLVPLSNYINKFIQDNYRNMYSKLKQFSLNSFIPKPFGIFPMIAINYNIIRNYY